MTTQTTFIVTDELRERIDMLREHLEHHSSDFWSGLASLVDIRACSTPR